MSPPLDIQVKKEDSKRIESIYFSKKLRIGVATIKDGTENYELPLECLKLEPADLVIDFIQSLLLNDVANSERTC